MPKRMFESDSSQSSVSSHRRCVSSEKRSPLLILVDHTNEQDHANHLSLLKDYKLYDNRTNIKFVVDNVDIPAHRPVIEILKDKRQLVRDAVDKDLKNAIKENSEAATIFQMSGTTVDGFRKLLEYIYLGKVECDVRTAINLANTAHKLKFHPLVASLAEKFEHNINKCISLTIVDELYHIAKCVPNKNLLNSCGKYMDDNAVQLNSMFLKRVAKTPEQNNVLIYCLDKSRYINYIQFLIPDKYNVCFTLSVSNDSNNWTVVLKNDEIWSEFWNWVYFEEKRIKYIKIDFTDLKDGQLFDKNEFKDEFFLCKRSDIPLEFDKSTGYLIPERDVIKFPIRDTKYYFDDKQKLFTYCMSKSTLKNKYRYYIYHNIGDKKFLEFYLSQTCLIDNFLIHLWDEDNRCYDFTVEVKSETDDDFCLIKDGNQTVFKNKSRQQFISLGGRRAVRWIKITGLRGPPYDSEFAIVDIECPAQSKKKDKK